MIVLSTVYHDNNGDDGNAVVVVYGGRWVNTSLAGIFIDNDAPALSEVICSRISKN